MFLRKRNFLTCYEVDKHLSDYKSQWLIIKIFISFHFKNISKNKIVNFWHFLNLWITFVIQLVVTHITQISNNRISKSKPICKILEKYHSKKINLLQNIESITFVLNLSKPSYMKFFSSLFCKTTRLLND